MAYTPINWQTGDTITADKLNRCDNGWSIGVTQLFSETITTANQDGYNDGSISYNGPIAEDTILVSFDGTDYVCDKAEDNSYGALYSESTGSIDFSVYPFQIWGNGGSYTLTTESAGTHVLSVGINQAETSSDFASAVNSVMATSQLFYRIALNSTTWQEARDAMAAGKLAFYVAVVDGDSVTQFVALRAHYNDDDQRYEILSVGAPVDGLASGDVIYATESNGALFRD